MARSTGWCVTNSRRNPKCLVPVLLSKTPKTQGVPQKIALSLKGMRGLAKPGKRVRYLCQDETRLGLKTIPGRLMTARGVKPIGKTQWQRDCVWLYGVVEPLTGFSFFYEFSHLDRTCLQQFLDLLSLAWGDDIALMQVDQATAHTANGILWPSHSFPTFQPSHCPALNLIERFWLFLKNNSPGQTVQLSRNCANCSPPNSIRSPLKRLRH